MTAERALQLRFECLNFKLVNFYTLAVYVCVFAYTANKPQEVYTLLATVFQVLSKLIH